MGATHQPIGQTAASCDWPEPIVSPNSQLGKHDRRPANTTPARADNLILSYLIAPAQVANGLPRLLNMCREMAAERPARHGRGQRPARPSATDGRYAWLEIGV